MTYTPSIFGARLTQIRELNGFDRGMVEASLAVRGIELTAERLERIEKGIQAITAFEFYGLSRLYGITFEELCQDFDIAKYGGRKGSGRHETDGAGKEDERASV